MSQRMHRNTQDTQNTATGQSSSLANRSSVDRMLTAAEIESVARRVEQLCSRDGRITLFVSCSWQGELRWARNIATMTSDRRDIHIFLGRVIRGGGGSAATNQLDDESLRGVVRSAERQALEWADRRENDFEVERGRVDHVSTTTWSEETFGRTANENAALVREVTEHAVAKGLMSAGYLESRAFGIGILERDVYGKRDWFVGRMTQAQCSTTVRHPNGTGSGWAGTSGYDFAKINERDIAKRALDKCVASLDPVRIEPGRYTTILEPQAVAQFVDPIFGMSGAAGRRTDPERRPASTPFWFGWDESVERHRTKLGLKVMDERITIEHDPSDPELGILPIEGVAPVTYVKNGILTALTYERYYALNELNQNAPTLSRSSYRMSGGTMSIEGMIATTKRGLLVTRFSSVRVLDQQSLLSTGVTRDGLWLIENGAITKSVRNFRFTESPLFSFNNVVDLGIPVPVFHPFDTPILAPYVPHGTSASVIVPALKVNDFSFTSTIDAV